MLKKTRLPMIILFLAPAVLLYLLIFFYPIIKTVIMSFFKMDSISAKIAEWEFVGLGNYGNLLNSQVFMQSLKNVFFIWLIGGIIIFFFAILFAVILTSGVKFKSFYRSIIYLPNVVSAVAMATMWIHYVYNSRYGLLRNIFSFLHIEKLAEFQWTSPENVFMALVIAYSFGMVGYFMLIFMAGIERIPSDFYEAATIDGANAFQQFFQITLPLLSDVIRTNVVLWTINAVGFFVWSQLFSPLIPEPGTVTPMVYMYQEVFGANNNVIIDRNVGNGAAVGVVLTLIIVISFAVTNIVFKDKKLEF
ncbi:carbohydrate ABC transporter permease [Brachyspira hampsonii]|uniref:Sugar ABC transporter permease n=1 Tax=Brachyspira hampsonii TaxID=1287055 RepID=A0AAC9TS00_9SPIR|nr:sugar ABC transporter permease [Brachyspira hampsonii]ASJ20333.1 sugar ABC transporter permease [Brachyspira hampsonii]ELV06677.1 permease component of ABC-type sugar transporter [Brachyspira hampsonii 30599]MBW5380444.1 sugar ABC transporter permease [Brachyspira hampsonii]OEJ16342.1 sugar ABC transporter permease [Brachyspira hampsonii]